MKETHLSTMPMDTTFCVDRIRYTWIYADCGSSYLNILSLKTNHSWSDTSMIEPIASFLDHRFTLHPKRQPTPEKWNKACVDLCPRMRVLIAHYNPTPGVVSKGCPLDPIKIHAYGKDKYSF